MNNLTLIGRLAKDPELKYSQSGKAYCRFSIAVPREFDREKTDFFDCLAWEKTAETIAQYLAKGRKIAIKGRMETGSYEKDGRNIKTYTVVIERFEFADSGESKNNKNDEEIVDDDDFPF